jgi:hypothetical protein
MLKPNVAAMFVGALLGVQVGVGAAAESVFPPGGDAGFEPQWQSTYQERHARETVGSYDSAIPRDYDAGFEAQWQSTYQERHVGETVRSNESAFPPDGDAIVEPPLQTTYQELHGA